MSQDIFRISGLFALVFNGAMGLFVYFQNKKNPLYVKFAIFSLSIAFWAVGSFFVNWIQDDRAALWALKICYTFGTFLPAFFVGFIYELTAKKDKASRLVLKTLYLASGIFFVLDLGTPSFISGLNLLEGFDFRITTPGPAYFLFFVYFSVVVGFALFILMREIPKASDRLSNQLKYIFASYLIGMMAGIEYFCSVFGILKRPPLDDYILIVTFAIMTYAILRHRLMDIDVIIKKTLVFAGLFAMIYGVFVFISSLGQEIFKNLFGFNQALAVIPTVVVLIFIHEPLKKVLTQATDRFLFQKKYNPAGLLRAFSREVVAEYDINQITRMTVRKLSEILRVGSCAIFVPDKDKDKFILKDSAGLKDQNIFFDKKSSGLCLELAKSGGIVLYRENPPLSRNLLEDLRKADARVAFAITGHNETIGLLTLGSKKSDEDYTKDDVELLKSLCDALGLAINTALVFEDTIQKEKLITVGTMVAGIRHDISNPVYMVDLAIQEFLMDKEEGRHASIPPAEFSSRVYHLVNHCRNTFKKVVAISAKFAEIARPKSNSGLLPAKLSGIVENYLSVFEHELETKKIRLQKEISTDDPEILCDQDYIEQVLFNLIRNAIYAIEESKKPEGLLRVKLYPKEDKVTIEIQDNGNGIPEDKLQKIFDSFYTTKPEGVGTGLGLAIVQELVERSNGTVRVESEVGKGATFILEFKIG